MSEEYQYLRYYMPGSLFLVYLAIILIPNSSLLSIILSNNEPFAVALQIVGLLIAAIGISPIIGFLVYAFYNPYYERRASQKDRGAFEYLDYIATEKSKDNATTKEQKIKLSSLVSCAKHKKEFLDLVVHTDSKEPSSSSFQTDIKEIMKGHLSKYAARKVCGLIVPLCVAIVIISLFFIGLINPFIPFILHFEVLIPVLILIGVISTRLLWDCERVIQEAFVLEEYLIKAKNKVVISLLEELTGEEMKECNKEKPPNRWTLLKMLFK